MKDPRHTCTRCGDAYPAARHALGYRTCLDCGDRAATEERTSWTVVCTPKGHYTRITRPEELRGLNQKPR